MVEFTVQLPLWAITLRVAVSLCFYPVWVEWANIKIAGLMPRFGKQLFPCVGAYLFISGCSLQESVISSPLKGYLKYACTLHFEATPWIHLRCYCKCSQVDCKSLGHSNVLLCMCVLMTIFWYDFPFLIVVCHSAVYGQTWELSKCAWYCYWGNLPQRIPEIKTSGAPRIWATQCVCEAEDFFCFPEIQCLGGSVWQRNTKNQNNMGFWN